MRWGLCVVFLLSGCGLEKLDVTEQEVPEEVWTAFEGSCSCHVGGMAMGGVSFDRSGSFVSPPLVVDGDIEESTIGKTITDGEMPPGGFGSGREADRFIILGWIADGAPLVDVEGGSTSTTDDSTTTGVASMTGDATTTTASTTGGETSDGTGGGVDYDAFVPVLEILQASCGGASCHRDGGAIVPVLEDDVAYDNLFTPSATGAPVPYVTPNDPAQSYLMDRLQRPDGDSQLMPLGGPALAQGDLDTITRWISEGAAR